MQPPTLSYTGSEGVVVGCYPQNQRQRGIGFTLLAVVSAGLFVLSLVVRGEQSWLWFIEPDLVQATFLLVAIVGGGLAYLGFRDHHYQLVRLFFCNTRGALELANRRGDQALIPYAQIRGFRFSARGSKPRQRSLRLELHRTDGDYIYIGEYRDEAMAQRFLDVLNDYVTLSQGPAASCPAPEAVELTQAGGQGILSWRGGGWLFRERYELSVSPYELRYRILSPNGQVRQRRRIARADFGAVVLWPVLLGYSRAPLYLLTQAEMERFISPFEAGSAYGMIQYMQELRQRISLRAPGASLIETIRLEQQIRGLLVQYPSVADATSSTPTEA